MSSRDEDIPECAFVRHSINNMLNALSMQAELGRHYMEQGNLEAAQEVMAQVIADCKRYSAQVRSLLPDEQSSPPDPADRA